MTVCAEYVHCLLPQVKQRELAFAAEGDPDGGRSSCTDFLRQMGYREYSRYLSFHFPFTHERSLLEHLRACPWRFDQRLFKVRLLAGVPILVTDLSVLLCSTYHLQSKIVMLLPGIYLLYMPCACTPLLCMSLYAPEHRHILNPPPVHSSVCKPMIAFIRRRGGKGGPATRWSTRRCASCGPPAGCTTGCAWCARRSWSRTCCCRGSGGSSTTGTPSWTRTSSPTPSAGSTARAALQVRPVFCAHFVWVLMRGLYYTVGAIRCCQHVSITVHRGHAVYVASSLPVEFLAVRLIFWVCCSRCAPLWLHAGLLAGGAAVRPQRKLRAALAAGPFAVAVKIHPQVRLRVQKTSAPSASRASCTYFGSATTSPHVFCRVTCRTQSGSSAELCQRVLYFEHVVWQWLPCSEPPCVTCFTAMPAGHGMRRQISSTMLVWSWVPTMSGPSSPWRSRALRCVRSAAFCSSPSDLILHHCACCASIHPLIGPICAPHFVASAATKGSQHLASLRLLRLKSDRPCICRSRMPVPSSSAASPDGPAAKARSRTVCRRRPCLTRRSTPFPAMSSAPPHLRPRASWCIVPHGLLRP